MVGSVTKMEGASGRVRNRATVAAALAGVVATLFAVGAAEAAVRTTVPVLAYRAPVTLTDAEARIMGKGHVTWPRGAVIQFEVRNNGSRAYQAVVQLTTEHHFTKYEAKVTQLHTGVIQPGRTGKVRVFFYFRSRFALQAVVDAKPHGKPAVIQIV